MNKFSKLILTSAIIATGTIASENNIKGEATYSSTFNVTADMTISNTGRVIMKGDGVINGPGKTITNNGSIDISEISDFSSYIGAVTGNDGSEIIIPRPKVTIAEEKKEIKLVLCVMELTS